VLFFSTFKSKSATYPGADRCNKHLKPEGR
jgi:hypothetical protein